MEELDLRPFGHFLVQEFSGEKICLVKFVSVHRPLALVHVLEPLGDDAEAMLLRDANVEDKANRLPKIVYAQPVALVDVQVEHNQLRRLRQALDELGMLIGRVTPDDVLDQVFANFCVGK